MAPSLLRRVRRASFATPAALPETEALAMPAALPAPKALTSHADEVLALIRQWNTNGGWAHLGSCRRA